MLAGNNSIACAKFKEYSNICSHVTDFCSPKYFLGGGGKKSPGFVFVPQEVQPENYQRMQTSKIKGSRISNKS